MPASKHAHHSAPALFFGALGVVYGDIGTSPLYTLRECFHAARLPVGQSTVFGILSLIAWALILVVTVKYVAFILRADNRGEGGILALTALAHDAPPHPEPLAETTPRPFVPHGGKRLAIALLGITGAALFYGDTLITPAITILSAVEGLTTINATFGAYVIPIALFLVLLLFGAQRHGTNVMGNLFGPVMLVWFSLLALFGAFAIAEAPGILNALNPFYGLYFLLDHHLAGFLTLGAVVLAVTGAEALYADLGHFGRAPVRRAWLVLVGPALLINYFGQGALLLNHPETLANPFFLMVPGALRLPMVLLATLASIIAAQAVISGAFSITRQAMQMGYLPRFEIRHTSARQEGQIYLPALNLLLMLGVLLIIINFRTSSNLAAAYGIAVTGTMAITTLLASAVLYRRFRWPLWQAVLFGSGFIAIDLLFLGANLHKIPHGGWFPVAMGLALVLLMYTWLRGREVTFRQVHARTSSLSSFLGALPARLRADHIHRPARAAVYLTADLASVPLALEYNLRHNSVVHQQVVLVKIDRALIPRVPPRERITLATLPHGFHTVRLSYGFMEVPNVPAALNEASQHHGLPFTTREEVTYFLTSHAYVPGTNVHDGLPRWQEPLYMLLERLSLSAVRFFRVPRGQVVEIGDHIEI